MTGLAKIAPEGDIACSLDIKKLIATFTAQKSRKVTFNVSIVTTLCLPVRIVHYWCRPIIRKDFF